MLTRYKFDITTLSEAWLKDNVLLLQRVNIPGYKVEFVNRPNPEKITADADVLDKHFNSTAKRLLDSFLKVRRSLERSN